MPLNLRSLKGLVPVEPQTNDPQSAAPQQAPLDLRRLSGLVPLEGQSLPSSPAPSWSDYGQQFSAGLGDFAKGWQDLLVEQDPFALGSPLGNYDLERLTQNQPIAPPPGASPQQRREFADANELVTGKLAPYRRQAEAEAQAAYAAEKDPQAKKERLVDWQLQQRRNKIRQEEIVKEQRDMSRLDIKNPLEYYAQRDAAARLRRNPGLPMEGALDAMSAGVVAPIQSFKDSGINLARDIARGVGIGRLTGEDLGNDYGQHAQSQIAAQKEEMIQREIDKTSPLGATGSELTRMAAGATGRMVPAIAAGWLTGSPATALNLMTGDAGLASFNEHRSTGHSLGESVAYGVMSGAIEYATEGLGQELGRILGVEDFVQSLVKPTAKSIAAAANSKSALAAFGKAMTNPTLKSIGKGFAGAGIEGLEELGAESLDLWKDYVFGNRDHFMDWAAAGQVGKATIVGVMIGGMGQLPGVAAYYAAPSLKAAQDAGVPDEIAKDPKQRQTVAAVAQAVTEAAAPEGAPPIPRTPIIGPIDVRTPKAVVDNQDAMDRAWSVVQALGGTRDQFDSMVRNYTPRTEDDWQSVLRPFRDEARFRTIAARRRGQYENVRPLPAEQQPVPQPEPSAVTVDLKKILSENPAPVAQETPSSAPPAAGAPGAGAGPLNAEQQYADRKRQLSDFAPQQAEQWLNATIGELSQGASAPAAAEQVAELRNRGFRGKALDGLTQAEYARIKQDNWGPAQLRQYRREQRSAGPEITSPQGIADRIRSKYGDSRYWTALKARGQTLDQYVAERMAMPQPPAAPAATPQLESQPAAPVATPAPAPAPVTDTVTTTAEPPVADAAPAPQVEPYPGRKRKLTDAPADRAEAWLRNTLERSPSGLDAAGVADWIRKGFGDDHYWTALQQRKQTLEQYVAEQMGAPAPKAPKSIDSLADDFRDSLLKGDAYQSIDHARKRAEQLTGSQIKPGTAAAKALDEAVETGVVKAARQIIRDNTDPGETFDALVDLYKRQPNLGVRTSTSMVEQAYSTPAPLAYLVQRSAGVERNTLSYDSAAGNGMLLTVADKPMANEINDRRVASLRSQGINATQEDATSFRPSEIPEAIVINPPFGQVKDGAGIPKTWGVDGIRTTSIDHAIVLNTLKSMPEDGTAALIIGSKGFAAGDPKPDQQRAFAYSSQKAFYDRLYDNYNVVDHYTVSGDLYARQGAKFPVDVIIIKGKGASSRPRPWQFKSGGLPEVFNTWESLKDAKLNGVRPASGAGARNPSGPVGQDDQLDGVSPGGRGPAPVDAGQQPESGGGTAGNGSGVGGQGSAGGSSSGGGGRSGLPSGNGRGPGGSSGAQPPQVPDESQPEQGAGAGPAGSGGPGGVAGGDSLSDEDALLKAMEDMFDDIEGTKKAPSPPPLPKPEKKSALPGPPRPPKADAPKAEPPAKPPTKIQQKAADARAEAQKALDDFLKGFKDEGKGFAGSTAINPEHLRRAATAAIAFTKAGVYTFAEFIEQVGARAPEMVEQLAPYLEAAWKVAQKRDTTGRVGPAGKVADVWKPAEKQQEPQQIKPEEETEFQVAYQPKSKLGAVGTLLPKNHVAAVTRALERIEEAHGDVDAFVAKELGLTKKEISDGRFSAEQIDALAMAIANDKNGKQAFVLADQTGVGKGRVVAGMMRYAIRKGLMPVFVTEKPSLYTDMMRDVTAIGMNEGDAFTPLITNPLEQEDKIDLNAQIFDRDPRVVSQGREIAERQFNEALANYAAGKGLKAKYRKKEREFSAIFTSYSQMSPVKGGQETWRHAALRKIAPQAYFIFDESHNAGGQGAAKKDDEGEGWNAGEDKITRSEFARELAALADNVMFSSATFAKRPEVMDLYARAGLNLAVADPTELPAMIEAGGVPLQQVVSEMMVEAGLMLRRERSFAGVDFAPQVVNIDLKDADQVSSIYRAINEFSELRESAVDDIGGDVIDGGGQLGNDNSTGKKGVDSQNFTSILWNLTDQMLLALKARSAAQEAIAAVKRGESPVIVVDNTLESALKRYVEDNGHKMGDSIGFSYRDLLQHYLNRSREVLVKKDRRDPKTWERVWITDEQLSPEALEAWNFAQQLVSEFDLAMPASPIDWIRKELQDAGLSVAEITGRSHMLDYSGSDTKSGVLIERPEGELGNTGKANTIKAFNSKKLDVLILNRSGSTGLSVHASREFKNTNKRHMIIAQAAKNIDEFMQMLGRVHRTGQVVPPRYTLLMTDAPAENRPAAVLLKKLASLNANVTASSKGSVTFDVPDIVNQVGDAVTYMWLADNPGMNERLSKPAPVDEKGNMRLIKDLTARVSGRVVMMPVEEQIKFWDDVLGAYEQRIQELNQMNANPLTAQNLDMDAKTVERFAIAEGTEGSESPFQEPAFLEKLDAKVLQKSFTSEQVKKAVGIFYGEEINSNLNELAANWANNSVKKLMDDGTKYAQERLAQFKAEDAEKLAKFDEKNQKKRDYQQKREELVAAQQQSQADRMRQFQDQANTIARVMRAFTPGTDVDVHAWGPAVRGTVIGVGMMKNTNPVAPSKWYVDIAVADALRKIRVPMTRITQGEVTQRGTRLVNLSEFDESSSVSRETRYAATGNLMAASAELEGVEGKSIVFFSDQNGTLRRGILLPRGFDPAHWQEKRPAVFKTADDALKFFEAGGHATTADGTLFLGHAGGQLVVKAPISRSRSGKYTTNPDLMAAAKPHEFTSLSNRMELIIPPRGPQVKVLAAIMKISPIQTIGDKAIAKRVLGDRIDAMRLVDSAPASPAAAKQPTEIPIAKVNHLRQTRSIAPRIPGDDSKAGVAARDIIKTWERIFDVPVRVGHLPAKAAGIYKYLTQVVRLKEKYIASLAVASHEIGHHVDNMHKITDPRITKLPETVKIELAGLDYQPLGRLYEGFAEFVRRYITEQNAKAVAPLFHRWFENWLSERPQVKAQFDEARKQAREFADQSIFSRITAAIGTGPQDLSNSERWKQKMHSKAMRMMESEVDRFVGLAQLEGPLFQAGWKGKTPYEVAMHFDMSSRSHAANALENGVHSIRTGHRLSDVALWSAKDHLENETEYDEAVAYAWAKHTLFMRLKNQKYNSGLDAEDAARWVARIQKEGRAERFDKFAKVISDYGDSLLAMLVDAGALSDEAAGRMIDYYGGNYFPLNRVKDDGSVHKLFSGAGFFNLPPAVRRRTKEGSGRSIVDPFDAMLARSIHDYDRAAKARVAASIVESLDPLLGGVEGFGGILDRVEPGRKVTRGQVKEILSTLVAEGIVHPDLARGMRVALDIRMGEPLSKRTAIWFARRHGIDPTNQAAMRAAAKKEPDALAEIALWRNDFTPSAAKRTVLYHDPQGQPLMYEMDDMLYRVATGLNQNELGPLLSLLRSGSTVMKAGATGINTLFAGKNLFRDYIQYQGQAQYVKGVKAPLVQPIVMLARYAAAKAKQRRTGKPLDEIDATVDFIEKTGGKIYTRLNSVASQQHLRRKMIGGKKKRGILPIDLPPIREMGRTVLDIMSGVTAWSDLPPRMAEAEAAIQSFGYERAGGKWRDLQNGQIVDYLPEYVQIKAGLAAANATINFKRGGTAAIARDAVMPYWRARVNALYRKAELLEKLQHAAESGEAGNAGKRHLLYMLALVGTTIGYWLQRKDDDDYREQEDHDRRNYWSVGFGGVTIARIPKPQSDLIVINLVENLLNSFTEADGNNSTGVLAGLAEDSKDTFLPTGGGALVGLAETYFNFDTFRDREIEPKYMEEQGVPVEYREDAYTLYASKLLSQYLGRHIGLSPLKVQHLLSSVSGGAYYRWSDTLDAAFSGDLKWRNAPMVGGFLPNRHQSRSVNDFYHARQKAREDAYREAENGVTDGPAAARARRMESYAELMAAIRMAEPKDVRGRRTHEYLPWLVGLSREALDRPGMESNPSPFDPGVNPPPAVVAALAKHVEGEIKVGILQKGRPQSGDDLARRTTLWNQRQQQAIEWINAHSDNPIVARERAKALTSPDYRDIMTGKTQRQQLRRKVSLLRKKVAP